MSISQTEYRGILDLPTELLYEVLQHSRPDDFEALMLSCKRIFLAGTPLITDHKECKARHLGSSPRPHYGHVLTVDVCLAYLRLATFTRRDNLVLFYHKRIEWSGIVASITQSLRPAEVIKKISSEALWLRREMMASYKDLHGLGFAHYDLFPVLLDCGPIEEAACDPVSGIACHEMLETVLLMMLHNLQSLILRFPPILDQNQQKKVQALPAVIDHCQGQKYFQQLRELHIQAHSLAPCTLNNIAPFLLLPRLKTLIVGQLKGYETLNDVVTPVRFEWPYGETESVLERLVLFEAEAEPDCIASLLKPLKHLHTFIWEDNTSQPISYENQLEFEKDVTYNQEYWQSYWDSTINYESDDEQNDSGEEDMNVWEKTLLDESSRTWNSAKLLDELIHHKDTLDHLALTIAVDAEWPILRRRHQIMHLKDFTKLTHLEIDVQVIKTRKGVSDDWFQRGIPYSLADFLPSSIQIVRLVVPFPRYVVLHSLLHKLAREKSRFPHLCKIRAIIDEPYRDQAPKLFAEEMKKQLEPLQKGLGIVGIELELESLQFGGFNLKGPRADIGKEDRPKGLVASYTANYLTE